MDQHHEGTAFAGGVGETDGVTDHVGRRSRLGGERRDAALQVDEDDGRGGRVEVRKGACHDEILRVSGRNDTPDAQRLLSATSDGNRSGAVAADR